MHIDAYPVHTAQLFRTWLHAEFKGMLMLVYVPANCTSALQVADVAVNRPFKAKYTSEFNKYQLQKFLAAPKETTGAALSNKIAENAPHCMSAMLCA